MNQTNENFYFWLGEEGGLEDVGTEQRFMEKQMRFRFDTDRFINVNTTTDEGLSD